MFTNDGYAGVTMLMLWEVYLLVIDRVGFEHMVQRLLPSSLLLLVEHVRWVRPVQISRNLIVLLACLHCQQLGVYPYTHEGGSFNISQTGHDC